MTLSGIPKKIVDRARSMLAREERGEQHRQPVELLKGMPAAPEPVLLPAAHWRPELHPKKAVAQLKVNGMRAFYVDNRILTRQALPLDAALHCLPALHRMERDYGCRMVFDGEYFNQSYEQTMADHKAGYGEGVFWLFDAVPYEQWVRNEFNQTLEERLERMSLFFRHKEAFLGMLEPWSVDKDTAIHTAMSMWQQGHEGLVIKDATSLYHRGRTKDWLKLKEAQNGVGVILDAVINDGKLKTLIVRVGGQSHRVSAMPTDIREAVLSSAANWQGRRVAVQWNDTTATGKLQGARILRAVRKED